MLNETTELAAVPQAPENETAEFSVLVRGQPLSALPQDLYIPPDALEVFLDAFQGPLDLLLYLIRKHNLDILDIPIAEVTRQYVKYVELMKEIKLELAADYLVMAAVLAEIKSRMLLPKLPTADAEEEDPRAELIRRLQEYEQIKQAAAELDALPREDRDWFKVHVQVPEYAQRIVLPDVNLEDLLSALQIVMKRASLVVSHQIQREPLSVRERMGQVLSLINAEKFIGFMELFPLDEGRMGVVVTLLAILELAKAGLLEIVQNENYAPIHVRAK
jgi:segregation and condensation protein A